MGTRELGSVLNGCSDVSENHAAGRKGFFLCFFFFLMTYFIYGCMTLDICLQTTHIMSEIVQNSEIAQNTVIRWFKLQCLK